MPFSGRRPPIRSQSQSLVFLCHWSTLRAHCFGHGRCYYDYRPLLTSGYTSNRRCVVTGIPARASSNVLGSVMFSVSAPTLLESLPVFGCPGTYQHARIRCPRRAPSLRSPCPCIVWSDQSCARAVRLTWDRRALSVPTRYVLSYPHLHRMHCVTHSMVSLREITGGAAHGEIYLVVDRTATIVMSSGFETTFPCTYRARLSSSQWRGPVVVLKALG